MSGRQSAEAAGELRIAWDGSHAAVAAVHAAIAHLGTTRAVTLVQSARNSGPRAEDAAAYLAHHGIAARVERPGRRSARH